MKLYNVSGCIVFAIMASIFILPRFNNITNFNKLLWVAIDISTRHIVLKPTYDTVITLVCFRNRIHEPTLTLYPFPSICLNMPACFVISKVLNLLLSKLSD